MTEPIPRRHLERKCRLSDTSITTQNVGPPTALVHGAPEPESWETIKPYRYVRLCAWCWPAFLVATVLCCGPGRNVSRGRPAGARGRRDAEADHVQALGAPAPGTAPYLQEYFTRQGVPTAAVEVVTADMTLAWLLPGREHLRPSAAEALADARARLVDLATSGIRDGPSTRFLRGGRASA